MDEQLYQEIKGNIDQVMEQLAASAARAGRKESDVRLMCVTKTKPYEYVEAAYKTGQRLFGENRVNELSEKFASFYPDGEVHLIGHLQRNKAKDAVKYASSIDSIDKLETAVAVNKYCQEFNKKINILLEYNTAEEASKSGFTSEDDFFATIDKIRELPNINIRGLMTVGPLYADLATQEGRDAVRGAFRHLVKLFNAVDVRHPDLKIKELSMGMSSDFDIAIEEGSTIIRIGTKLFGARQYNI